MRVKTKGFLTGAIIILFMALFALLAVFINKPTTANAAVAWTNLLFDYSYFNDEELALSECGVMESSTLICGKNDISCSVRIQAQRDVYSPQTSGTATNYTNKQSFRIRTLSNFDIVRVSVVDKSDNIVANSTVNTCLMSLSEGEYTLSYTGTTTWVSEENPQKLQTVKVVCTLKLVVDVTPPVMISSIGGFEKVTAGSFSVIAFDEKTDAKLYYYNNKEFYNYSSNWYCDF